MSSAAPSAVAAARLRNVRFYVLPRMSPDGAEAVLANGRYVRSVPRDERPARAHAYWRCDDVDGDGLALTMRVRDPGGELVESPEFPGLLLPRTIDDPPPYYKVYPEGVIENFDGSNVPTPHFLSDNQTDLNRNFPYSWAPDSKQEGAGAFPLSEIESRAVVEFAIAHPEIFLWLNLHTFGGVFIRPLGDKPDSKMNPEDLALYRQLGAWAEELTGYPMVSGCEEFLYEPDTPLHGDLTDYAYHQRGAVAYVVELWDLFKQVGFERKKRFVDNYTQLTRADMLQIAVWDRDKNGESRRPAVARVRASATGRRRSRRHRSARRDVESAARGDAEDLHDASRRTTCARRRSRRRWRWMRSRPRALSPELTRVTVTVANHGYLPTYVLASARALTHNEPLWADVALHRLRARRSRPRASRDRPPRRLGPRPLRRLRRALLHAHPRHDGLAHRCRGSCAAGVWSACAIGSCRVGWTTRDVEVG